MDTEEAPQVEPERMLGHLRIVPREGYKPGERLLCTDLLFELDGVDIGNRLYGLKLEINKVNGWPWVLGAELSLYVTDVEIDLPDTEINLTEVVAQEKSEA